MLDPSDASQKTRNVRNPSGANAPAVEVGGVLVSTGLLTSGWAARHEEVGQETGREIGSDIVWHAGWMPPLRAVSVLLLSECTGGRFPLSPLAVSPAFWLASPAIQKLIGYT